MFSINGEIQFGGGDYRVIQSLLMRLCHTLKKPYLFVSTPAEGNTLINREIKFLNSSEKDKEKLINDLLDVTKQSLLPLAELDWIKKDERACYFVWASVQNFDFYAAPDHPTNPLMQNQPITVANYRVLNLKANPSNSNERFDEIVKFIDRVFQPLEWQMELIEYFKKRWSSIYTSRRTLSWLNKNNEEQCRWAWEYINKPKLMGAGPSAYRLKPTGCYEMYLAIFAALDSWDGHLDSQRLFLIDFNKAWQQKKHRDSRQGKKACNLVLREEVKQKLDELASSRGMKLNQIVEQLIENEYDNDN